MNNKMLALYGLKWNPFAPNVPTEALHVTPRLELFCWRVQQLAGEGGFALVTGAPGCGKSGALRILSASLATQRDVTVGVISRPQANIADFYREMGELFGVELRPHNRYGGAKILRQRWQAHIQSTLSRPVLVVDEAQEMQSAVLAELRLLASADLDSNILLTTVLAGDGRLAERLRADEFLPLASRMRVRLPIERAPPQDLQDCLRHALQQAGAPTLMTPEVIATICDHALGNLRALMIMAGELSRRPPPSGRPVRSTRHCSSRPAACPRRTRPKRRSGAGDEPASGPAGLASRRLPRAAALARRWAVVGTSRRDHRRRTQVLQILPRPRSGRCRRRRHPLPAPLRGGAAPAASCSIPPKTHSMSSVAASKASVPPPAPLSPNSTSR